LPGCLTGKEFVYWKLSAADNLTYKHRIGCYRPTGSYKFHSLGTVPGNPHSASRHAAHTGRSNCMAGSTFAQELADQYLVMERGEVIARGPGSEMKEKNIQQLVAI
jgi:hypothetical protein